MNTWALLSGHGIVSGHCLPSTERKTEGRLISMLVQIVAITVVCTAVVATAPHVGATEVPYYGYFPSALGAQFKRLTHNALGFSIDIPSNWVFGVSGAPPLGVVLVYPEGMDSSKFSTTYESIEIGRLPFLSRSLEEAQATVMRGMQDKHPGLRNLRPPRKAMLGDMSSISWIFKWPSKSGYEVTEYITLVAAVDGTRSLAVRTTRADFAARKTFYDEILKAFEPFKSKF